MHSGDGARNQSQEEERLRAWVEGEMERGIPLQHVEDALMLVAHVDEGGRLASALSAACLTVAHEVLAVMDDRYSEGKRLEQSGRVDDAVRLYEENVRDRSLRTGSYVRLVGIYHERGDEAAVIRVERALTENLRAGNLLTRVPVG